MVHWARRWQIVLLALLSGCGISPPVVSVVGDISHQRYSTQFTNAYMARDSAGDYVVVLLQEPSAVPNSGPAGNVLQPTPTLPVCQAVVIRLLWQPMDGAKPDSPAATNAAVHWYVLSMATAEGTSFIRYDGTAFVKIRVSGSNGDVIIRNGSLKIVDRHGNLVDPLKSFQLNGEFEAVADDAKLHQILEDVKSAMADAKTGPANLPDSQPPARPIGP